MFHLFRSFLPLHNPIGFGASDFIELAFAALLVIVVLIRARLAPIAQKLAAKPGWVMLLFAVLPVALRWNPILGYGANPECAYFPPACSKVTVQVREC